MNLSQVKIYRILHIDNIPHILSNGITHKNSPNANLNFVGIGDISLIDNRSNRQVHIDNGNVFNIETITLGDFTPFYFGVKMPMLYVVQHGGNFVEKANNPEDIIYVVCSVESIVNSSLRYYFSDGHATDFLTTFYNKDEVTQLPQLIDWTAVKTPYWGGQENLVLKERNRLNSWFRGMSHLTSLLDLGVIMNWRNRN